MSKTLKSEKQKFTREEFEKMLDGRDFGYGHLYEMQKIRR